MLKTLKDIGLTQLDSKIYVFLGKRGPQKGKDISRALKVHKQQIYRSLKNLQRKGLISATLDHPANFSAEPFPKVLDLFIKVRTEEANCLRQSRAAILSDWQSITVGEIEDTSEKFTVIKGRNIIYSKILQMMQTTKKHLSAMTTVTNLARVFQFGLFDATGHPTKDGIRLRFLTELSKQDVNAVEDLLKRVPSTFNLEVRIPHLGLKLSRIVIRDGEEAIFFVNPGADSTMAEQDDVCLWTNCKSLAQAFMGVFENLWRNSTDIQRKIEQIETGKPSPTTSIISNPPVARKKYDDALRSAEKEIIMMTSSEGLLESWKNLARLKEWARKDITVKIMAPLISENWQAAQELSGYCAIRHVPVGYLETTIVDGKHLFQFEDLPVNEVKPRATTCFEDVFYTNDVEYVKKTKNMLNAVWKNARPPSSITLESIIGPQGYMVPSLPEIPFKKVRDATIIQEQKIITEKDVLKKIISAKKIPARIPCKDTLRLYGSTGAAVIHPPEYFDLPDMIISAWHIDKHSSLGAEDMLGIYLWLETPTGPAYVPAASIGDNPQAVEFRKGAFARAPTGHNCHLIEKEELHVRVHGNTLFAGWTVPIKLFPSKYTLPPACILFEGYGELKTGAFKVKTPWAPRPQLYEFNGFEAFITFFHPSSKYTGPGTDGFLCRDVIITVV